MKEILRAHIEKIILLTDEELDLVFSFFTYKKFKKNQYLIQEGDYVDKDFWVVEGLLKSYFTEESGKEHILQFAMADWWISDYQAYFHQTKSTINVDCIEPTTVFYITLENREKLCEVSHNMANFFRKKSNHGYVALKNRILTLLSLNPKEKHDRLLKKYPELFQRVPKSLIASYLGLSRETLSRLNSKK